MAGSPRNSSAQVHISESPHSYPRGCPICKQDPKDVRHLLFQCQSAIELWSSLGLQPVIEEAASADMAGSAMLEHILRRQDNSLPGFSNIGLKETISMACWYLWWLRRRKTHNEQVPPIHRCKISILSITSLYYIKWLEVVSHGTSSPLRSA
jgi:hypothetical protein